MPFPRVRISFIQLRHPSPLDSLRATFPSSSSIPTSYTAPFSTSSPCRAASREPTLYEVLDVPITATTAEIKKYRSPSIPPLKDYRLTQTKQTILLPLPPPPPRQEPHRPPRNQPLLPHLLRLQHPRQRRQALHLRPRTRHRRPPSLNPQHRPTRPTPNGQPQQPQRKPPQPRRVLRRLPARQRPQ